MMERSQWGSEVSRPWSFVIPHDKIFCFAKVQRLSSPPYGVDGDAAPMIRLSLRPNRSEDPTRRVGRLVRCAGVVTLWGAAICALTGGSAGCHAMAAAAAAKNAIPAAQ